MTLISEEIKSLALPVFLSKGVSQSASTKIHYIKNFLNLIFKPYRNGITAIQYSYIAQFSVGMHL